MNDGKMSSWLLGGRGGGGLFREKLHEVCNDVVHSWSVGLPTRQKVQSRHSPPVTRHGAKRASVLPLLCWTLDGFCSSETHCGASPQAAGDAPH
eukprot:COSAG01_NODE_11281_length_1966_cov_8.566149_4_plen_94_part_00